MRDQFENILSQKTKDIKELNKQISIFRSLEKDGNIAISFDEMNPDAVIRKLSLISWNSQEIWNACIKHFKKGFFKQSFKNKSRPAIRLAIKASPARPGILLGGILGTGIPVYLVRKTS